MNQKKLITLDSFIDEALYHKRTGYYMKKSPFGKKGDFITAPGISILFSEMITIWIVLYWESLGKPKKFNIVELGSGDGELMLNMIKTSKNFPNFFKNLKFYIFEKSNYLKEIQKKKLKGLGLNWISNLNNLEKNKTLFIGNEFLDAFPIKQFIKKDNIWYEKYVEKVKNKYLLRDIKVDIKKYSKIVGFNFFNQEKFIEISLNQITFLKKISVFIKKRGGGILFIDYGFLNKKMFDSLQSVSKHRKSNFLLNKGDQDITHLINFSFLKKYFYHCGLNAIITTQGNFLKSMGIMKRAEIMSKNKSFLAKSDIFFRVKRLTDIKQIKDLFKVIFATQKKHEFKKGFDV